MTEVGWLRCEAVVQGMFSDERAVLLTKANGSNVSFFVPSEAVAGDRLKVGVFRRNGYTWAILPTPYSDAIAVQPSDLDPGET